jgi:CHAT domain-containing protein
MKFNLSTLSLNNKLVAFLSIILGFITNNAQVIGQNITSAHDNTGTIVNIDGNTFNITGGTLSGDGANLFHSLQQFGLTSEQIANFLSNPNINNILTRIVGGSPSFIDGLIQVTGGNSNLFLMNPAGIVFGSNASLNLLGDFTATTATGIGFNNHWFNAIGDNNYANLIGNPSSFAFDLTENGTIINLGNLEVAKGQSLTLLGGTVINTGNLRASEGNINIVSIPGTSKIAISQPGDVISIVIEPPRDTNGNMLPFKATDIPTLITQGVTGLAINNNNEIVLIETDTVIPQEQGITINTGNIDVSSVDNTAGNITILGNKIGILGDSLINADGNTGGGNIRIGGDYQGKGNIFNAQNTFIGENVNINANALTEGDGGRVIIWADDTTAFYGNIFARGGNISGDGGFAEVSGNKNLIFRGNGDLGAINGNFGTLLLDPENIIISNDASATISQATVEAMSGNTNIVFEATNNITIGSLTNNELRFQTGIGNITFTADSDNNNIGSFFMNPTDQIFVLNPSGVTEGRTLTIKGFDITTGGIQGENLVFGGKYANTGGSTSNIILTATHNISMGQIRSASASVLPDIKGGDLSINAGGSITVTGNLVSWTSNDGGNITLKAQNDITINCTATNFCIETFSGGNPFITNPTGNSGNLIIESSNGNINILGSNSAISTYVSGTGSGLPGNVELTAFGDIKVSGIASESNNNNGNTGIVKIISTNGGTIDTSGGRINTSSYTTGNGATISIDTTGTVILGQVNSNAPNGTSGNINVINSNDIFLNQNIDTSGINRGEINFSGAVTLNNNVTLTGGDINFASTLDGQKNLTINSLGNVDFNGLVGSLTPLQSLNITNANPINIYNNITTNDGITLNAPSTVHNPVTLNAGTGTFTNTNNLNTGNNALTITADDVNLASTITGTNSLNIQPFSTNRNIDLGTNTANTLGLTANEISNISNFTQLKIGRSDGTGNITVSSPVTFNVPTEILSGLGLINLNADVTSNNQNLIFGNILLGNNVTISTGAGLGDLTFNGTINGTQNLTTNSGTGNTTFNGVIGGTNPLQNLNITTQNLDINSQINTTNNGTFTLNNTGNFNLNALLNLDGNFTQTGTGNNFLNADILTTNDNISFASAVTLSKTLNLTTGTGTLSFNGALNLGNNPQSFTTGELNFNGGNNSVTGTNTLTIQTATDNQNINLGGTEGTTALDLTNTDINALNTNFTNVTIGNDNGSGIMTVVSNINFTNPTILKMPKGNAVINGQITGSDDASINLTAINTNLNNNIVTNNQNQTLNTNINLGNNVRLDTGTGDGNITVNGTIDNNYNLTLNAGTGNINLNGLLGGTTPLNSFNVTNANNLFLESGIIVNGTNLNFNSPVTLTNNIQLSTAGGNINFNNILNSVTGESNNLLMALGTGNLNINNPIGNNQPLGNININSVNNIISNSPITANSLNSNNGTGSINLGANVNTNNGTNLTTNGNINTQDITTTGGNINLTSNNGNVTVGNLTTSSVLNGGNINLTSVTGIVNSGNLITNSTNNGGNVSVIALQSMTLGDIDTSATVGNGGNVFLDPIGDIQFGYINAQGGTNGVGGDVDMTTTQGLVRGLNVFIASNGLDATISTIGGLGGGSITIRHNGGDLFIPFIVNDARISGVAGALTTGDFTISPVRVFPGSYYLGNISIITSDRFTLALADSLREPMPEPPKIKDQPDKGFFLDEYFTRQYERYFNDYENFENSALAVLDIKSLSEIQNELAEIEEKTKIEGQDGVKPALIYAVFQPKNLQYLCENTDDEPEENESEEKLNCIEENGNNPTISHKPKDDDILTLVLVTSKGNGNPVVITIPEATRAKIKDNIHNIHEILAPKKFDDLSPEQKLQYQQPSYQLYQWLIEPLKTVIEERELDNLVFIMDQVLRSLPVASLYQVNPQNNTNQRQYLIEEYSLGLMPSMSITDNRYFNIQNQDIEILAMGSKEFIDNKKLEYAPLEVNIIAQDLRQGIDIYNQNFIYSQLRQYSANRRLIHLSTHGEFKEGNPENSYIQLYDEKLYLKDENLRPLNLYNLPTELLVLSACETALGDQEAELGFAGAAHRLGVKSVGASLWFVDQEATFVLMTHLYQQLNNVTKAEALRQAQIALIKGEWRDYVENLIKKAIEQDNNRDIPMLESLDYTRLLQSEEELKHPHFWAGFTMIGNPW